MICNGVPERETELTLHLNRNFELKVPTNGTVRPTSSIELKVDLDY